MLNIKNIVIGLATFQHLMKIGCENEEGTCSSHVRKNNLLRSKID